MTDRIEKYIEIKEHPKKEGKKTRCWEVVLKVTGEVCGEIKWYGGWRKYVYYAKSQENFYDSDFLKTIGQFCEDRTAEHYRL